MSYDTEFFPLPIPNSFYFSFLPSFVPIKIPTSNLNFARPTLPPPKLVDIPSIFLVRTAINITFLKNVSYEYEFTPTCPLSRNDKNNFSVENKKFEQI